MLESPLKKNKHSYPIEFSNKKKQSFKYPPKKYDLKTVDEANPEAIIQTTSGSAVLSGSSISQIFIQTKKRLEQSQKYDFFSSQQPLNISPTSQKSPLLQNLLFCDQLDGQSIEQPLRQVKRKSSRIIIDENKLKNPRIQINQQVNIPSSQKTLQTLSTQKMQMPSKTNIIGSIRHQDFKFFQQFEDEKQPPLLPQKPYSLINKNITKNSLLHKLNLGKITEKYHNTKGQMNIQTNARIHSFRPETYTYANKIIASSQQKLKNVDKIDRASSSFDVKRKQKITYINQRNKGNLSFGLPNLPFSNNDSIGFAPVQQERLLRSKAWNGTNLKLQNNKCQLNLEEQSQHKMPFENKQINKIKAQINMIAQNRFKNRQNCSESYHQKQRQFTFQGPYKNQPTKKQPNQRNQSQSSQKQTKKLEVTYHVPLTSLKRLCRTYLSSPQKYSLAFKVPKIFMQQDLFTKDQSKQQLHQNGLLLFESLKISSKDMIIKRYSNCIMFFSGHIVIMWYYNGKRYLGGWQYQYLDEGSRHGLGLQWEPDSYIYYGEFRNNKKHGLGTMKEGPQKVLVGYWATGKYIGIKYNIQEQKKDEIRSQYQQGNEQKNKEFSEEDQQYDYT